MPVFGQIDDDIRMLPSAVRSNWSFHSDKLVTRAKAGRFQNAFQEEFAPTALGRR